MLEDNRTELNEAVRGVAEASLAARISGRETRAEARALLKSAVRFRTLAEALAEFNQVR
jgi:hypothetical protein